MRSIVEKTLAGLPVTILEDPFFVLVRHGDVEWRVSQLTGQVDGVNMDTSMFRAYVQTGILMDETTHGWADRRVDWQPPEQIRIGRTGNGLLMLRDRTCGREYAKCVV